MNNTEEIFKNIGGQFVTPAETIAQKLQKVKVFAFDWDGVFNDAIKSTGHPNGFSEADSMGINLMRYDYFLRNGELPFAAIITGEENPTARDFARRESFFAVYFRIKDKGEALKHFCSNFNIEPENIAWFFDDILDLNVAKQCGVRFYLGRKSQPLTTQFILDNGMVDYITAHEGGQNAIRECAELTMALNGTIDTVLNHRLAFDANYANYFAKRNMVKPVIFTKNGDAIQEVES